MKMSMERGGSPSGLAGPMPRATNFARREAETRARRVAMLDALADERDRWRQKNDFYYRSIEELVRFVVPAGARVLEIGCGTGDLLAALAPAEGVGVDISPRMLDVARGKYPHLEFVVADAESLEAPALEGRTFDYVVMSDVVGQLSDVWAAFRALRRFTHPRTRIFISYYNFLWEPVLRLGERAGLKMPIEQQNWLGMQDLANLLALNHLEVIRSGTALLVPRAIPLLARFANRYLARLPGLRHLCLTHFFVARPAPGPIPSRDYSCSVVVPCRNERGNVDDIVARTPDMGRATEIVFVDGNSNDGTVQEIERHIAQGTRPGLRLIHQGAGTGKGDAVRKGFAAATGDILFILDADLTVPPEDLPKFYAAVAEGKAEFVNGSRLVYPMEGKAMRFLNLLGNKGFGMALSFILGQRLKDTLCGTKVLLRRDYERIAAARGFFGDFDPFGDFDLLFGAAKQNLKLVELPVRYRDRTYGETKISRFRHGWLLAKMTLHAFRRFRLAY
ncbi:MAG TPA: bifunctional class I SAM-dependent methyltransferase/glycosyltransferase family 2 protein [Polyangia bacterium]|nr:bifunctional class I SAM-dependent methyltransferase/glycosyltransferase family 2 protein [Polyangia bacterium]